MGAINAMDERLRHGSKPERLASGNEGLDRSQYRGRTWVTRAGVHVDRIASAWLIRRFIDPEAHFKFVPGKATARAPASCASTCSKPSSPTRATAARSRRCSIGSASTIPGAQAIAEIVHDIDLKDAKFGRQEAAGIARLIEGIAAANPDDEERLTKGEALFDDLVAAFGKPVE